MTKPLFLPVQRRADGELSRRAAIFDLFGNLYRYLRLRAKNRKLLDLLDSALR